MTAAAAPTSADLRAALVFALIVIGLVWLIRWTVLHVAADGYWVYEIDTEEGELLYVGSAANPRKRMHSHENFQRRLPDGHPRKWWADAEVKVRHEYWPTRATWYRSKLIAQAIEKQRVRERRPIANRIRYTSVPGGGD